MKENEVETHFGIVPCYLNIETMEIRGRNTFYHMILSIYFWIEVKLGYLKEENE